MSFAARLRLSAPAPAPGAPPRPAPARVQSTPGFTVRRTEIDKGGLAPAPAAMARALASVGTVPRGGLCPRSPAVLLDLETTGLGRDAGVVPFMVGLAAYEGDVLVVEQWVLSRLSAERRMLAEVLERLADHLGRGGALVTYNGATFDLPLLRGRLVRHRLARPGERTVLDGLHFDLLVAARRLWKGRRPDCRLATLERLELAVRRQGDIAGAEIADAYWRWLAGPDDPDAAGLMERIETHNRIDLVSLAGLAGEIGRLLARPVDLPDVLRAAIHHARQQRPDAALSILRPALPRTLAELRRLHGARPICAAAIALLAADLHRRAGDHTTAAALWAEVCRAEPGHPEAHDRLAKHFEHHARDPASALAVAQRSSAPCPRRLARLQRKITATGAGIVPLAAALGRAAAGSAAVAGGRV